MSSLIKSKTAKAKKAKPNFVRITIDPQLEKVITEIQNEYPLLSTAEAVKIILSRGVKAKAKTFPQILSNSKFLDITDEDEQFKFIKENFGV